MRNNVKAILAAILLFSAPAWAEEGNVGIGTIAPNETFATTIDDFKDKKMDMKLEPGPTVELQADQVEYSAADTTARAKGNVVVTSGKMTMTADQLQMNRTTNDTAAQGHVFVDAPQMKVDADAGTFNFTKGTGTFTNGRIFVSPFQIKGQTVAKVSDNHMVMEHGFMTTCDHDKPHFRLESKRMDVYPGDKAIARGVKMYVGNVPVMYFAKYVQDLKNKPWFTFMPGSKKDLGLFLLTRSRFKVNEDWDVTVRVDLYERQGIGWGMDHSYNAHQYGAGLVRTYFINERQISAKHPWMEKKGPTIQNERYKLEWRHKWDIDDRTQAIWQYYRLSDNVLLNKYFEREYRRDPSADTYFLLTRSMPVGSLSFRVDHRVNRFVAAVDRHPELNYNFTGYQLGDTGLYWQSNNTVSNLVSRAASPTEDRRKTVRVDTDNEISYPMKVTFVNVTPMVGGDETYYSRTNDARRPTNIVRSTFKTGADLSTRFFKVMDMGKKGFLGTGISRIRHIVAPSVSYRYYHTPSFQASRLNQFDAAIDGLRQQHTINFSLENKIQAKQGKRIWDLVRWLTTVPYYVKQTGSPGNLGPVKNLVEVTPVDWMKIISETTFDHRKGHINEGNFDFYFKPNERLGFSLGERYARGQSHQLTTQTDYILNPKWRVRIYNAFEPLSRLNLKEQEYTIVRDLHEWEMNFVYNQTRGGGNSVLVTFTLKAFPDQPFDLFGTSFHQRKAGSQSTTP